jgi:signal transduction histidine kinase
MQSYRQGLHSIDDQVRNQMKICSFDLKCEGLELDFVPKTEKTKVRKLYKKGNLYSYFEVPTVDEYLLKVILPQKSYEKRLNELKIKLIQKFILYALLIALLSFLFSLYALRPLKKALDLNEEFVKDILHDINTPLSSLIVNFKLFKKEIGENRKIDRMESSVATILSLQNNLKAFLDNSLLQQEKFALSPLLQDRISYFQTLYPKLHFVTDIENYKLYTNKDAFIRVIDNLLSNACKYNYEKGRVEVVAKEHMLFIKDNGQGIKNVKKVFNRFYKETERGMGIGLHIVQKLCTEVGIGISIESKITKGTVVKLDLQKVILK